jgi:hypothetical protein
MSGIIIHELGDYNVKRWILEEWGEDVGWIHVARDMD